MCLRLRACYKPSEVVMQIEHRRSIKLHSCTFSSSESLVNWKFLRNLLAECVRQKVSIMKSCFWRGFPFGTEIWRVLSRCEHTKPNEALWKVRKCFESLGKVGKSFLKIKKSYESDPRRQKCLHKGISKGKGFEKDHHELKNKARSLGNKAS